MTKLNNIKIVALSNQLEQSNANLVQYIKNFLESLDFNVELSHYIFKSNNLITPPDKRAFEFNQILRDNTYDFIIDISGGDLSNELIPFINLDCISNFKGIYIGYSDLTTILSLFINKDKKCIYFNFKTIIENKDQQALVENILQNHCLANEYITNLKFDFILGRSIKGKLIGGNIRCLLKLAGTNFMPSFTDKILFLESFSGDINRIRSYIAQYDMLNVFSECKGIVLGQFTQVDNNGSRTILISLFKAIATKYNIPLLSTLDVGHSSNAKPLILNSYIKLSI